MRAWLVVLAACATAPPAMTAPPWERRACDGLISPEVDAMLTKLAAPTRDHCEQHEVGAATELFVRTMTTVAHDDAGDPLPACQWEVFRVAPPPVVHLRSAFDCQLRIPGRS